MSRRIRRERTQKALIYLGITAITLVLVFPFLWMVSTSLKERGEMFAATPTFFPKAPTMANYVSMWNDYKFYVYLKNSLLVASATTVTSLLFATFLAYGVSRFKFRGKTAVFDLLILTQMFPLPLLIITLYVSFAQLGLIDSRVGLTIAYCTFAIPFATMMLKAYFDGLPVELEEAASIDGCGPIGTIFRIVVPISSPAIAAMGLFSFILAWQEFMMALTLIRTTSLRTLPVGITMMVGFRDIMWGPLMAGTSLVTMPVVILFIYFQKYLITGMTMGAVKG
ncbi:MAG: carbohydrate ABC transporter permease [Candidatus Limiplasma sp.]|nr:carbohydrate ABC transporter permease [Candidatus Limiplasma sp.]